MCSSDLNPRMTVGDIIAEPLETFYPELSAPGNIVHALEILAWMFLGMSCTLIIIAAIDKSRF